MLTLPDWGLFTIGEIGFVLIVLVIFLSFRVLKYRALLSKQITQQNTDSVKPATVTPDMKYLGEIKEKLALAEQRVKNLERFRELFFELKSRIESLMEQQQHMVMHMQEAGLPLEEQQALIASFEKLKNEKVTLEKHLQQLENELGVLAEVTSKTPKMVTKIVDGTNIVLGQQAKIGKLLQDIAALKLEAATSQHIHTSVHQISKDSDDLSVAIEVLQDENQYLNEQVETLLKQQKLVKEPQQDSQFDLITRQLAEKQLEFDELYKKHIALEKEYLKSKT